MTKMIPPPPGLVCSRSFPKHDTSVASHCSALDYVTTHDEESTENRVRALLFRSEGRLGAWRRNSAVGDCVGMSVCDGAGA